MNIGPLPPIDAASLARQADASLRAAAAGEIAGPVGDNDVSDDSASDGRYPQERPAAATDKSVSGTAPPSIDPASGSQLDLTA